MAQNGAPGVPRAALGVAILAATLLISIAMLRPPVPKSSAVPATQFSAGRAFDALKRIVGDELPHPVGSSADGIVRGRVIAELKVLGYAPEVQTAFACSQYGTCATVNNIVSRLDSAVDGPGLTPPSDPDTSAVLLSAHYDSVPAGPGVSDDAVGVAAVLEVARALKSLSPPKHSIILLIDDGEEGGLLGAHAFVESHRWAHNVRAAVNLEARGTSGSSLMFETGSANQWAVRLFATRAAHPSASSISYTVYKRLPNDTDFTVFKAAGYQGLNFAFIGDEPHYHTPLDNIANGNLASLQHQGDNALSSVVTLANADLSNIPEKDDVYFDLFQMGVVRLDARWALPFALLTIVLLAAQIAWLGRCKRLSLRKFFWGLLLWLVILVLTAILATLLRGLLRLGGALPVDWVAHPFPLELAFWSLAAAVVLTLGILFGRRAGFWGLWTGMWAWWGILAALAAWLATGVSYVFLVPSGIAALVALPVTVRPNTAVHDKFATAAAIVPLLAAGVVGFTPLLLLYEGMGNRTLSSIAVLVAIILTPLLPFCQDISNAPGRRGALFSWIPIATFLTAAFLAVIVPQFSTKAPERVNIQYWKDADSGRAQWVVEPDSGRLPEPIGVAAVFKRADKGPFPWDRGAAYFSPAPGLTASEPSLTILQSSLNGSQRKYRALLRSERAAPQVLIVFPPKSGVGNVTMQGHPLEPASEKQIFFFGDWKVYRCLAAPSDGVEMTFTLPFGKPLQVYVVDISYGLPAEGKFLLNSRPLTAVPSHDGDVTLISRAVQLLP